MLDGADLWLFASSLPTGFLLPPVLKNRETSKKTQRKQKKNPNQPTPPPPTTQTNKPDSGAGGPVEVTANSHLLDVPVDLL